MSGPVEQAAALIAASDGILITAGAGMGVDSGLPDFRGTEGFWKAYPALANAGIDFQSIANPSAFRKHPRLAWGFYGHRLELYRTTIPHDGFRILKRITDRLPHGSFVITSNVDGQFQKARFSESQILEIHGSIHRLQCFTPCRDTVWSADKTIPVIDTERGEWVGAPLPTCARCHRLARPNILMFDDWNWIQTRADIQRVSWLNWASQAKSPIVIEIGAGIEVPSIRRISEGQGVPVIRINPRDGKLVRSSGVSVMMEAKDALESIELAIEKRGFFG